MRHADVLRAPPNVKMCRPSIGAAGSSPATSASISAFGLASVRMRAIAAWPCARARNDAPMPQRTAYFASVATVAGPARPMRIGHATPSARRAAIHCWIGCGSNPNCVTNDVCQSAPPRDFKFGQQRRVQRAAVDLRMAFGIAGERHRRDAVTFDHAGGQQHERTVERTDRPRHVAAQQQHLRHPGFVDDAPQEIARLR